MYEIEFSKEAVKHVLLMRKSSPQLFKKLEKLLDELREHPYTGTGHPEQLRYLEGVWSRQLDKAAGQEEPYQVYGQRDYRNCIYHFSLGTL